MKDQVRRGLSATLVLLMVVSLLSGAIAPVYADTYIPEETVITETQPADGALTPTGGATEPTGDPTEPTGDPTEPSEPATEPAGTVPATEPESTAAATEPAVDATEGAEGAATATEAVAPDGEELGGSSRATYSKNTGTRGAVCTSLPTAATSFYSSNGVTYEDLAELSGASNTSSTPSSALYKRLQKLMKDNHKEITSYDDTRRMYQYTDCQNGGAWNNGKISSFYSGKAIGPAWDGGGTWNREHVWPNSKGLEGSDENDIMMLRPTSMQENSTRGNKAYGESSNYYHPNSESGGSYDVRGDVARIILYVYTRWGNTTYMWGQSGVIESKAVLLKWVKADPVDTWEMGRNNVVQEITGTRNVFVDYPELAFRLFEEAIPSDMTTPSGKAGETYEITVEVNDSAMGSATLSGNNINATPAAGYMVSGYEVVSGTATVSRSGNSFTVSASSDCTIKIIFAAKTQVNVVYKNDTTQISAATAYSGDTITLPAFSGTLPKDYTFLGWTDETVDHSDTMPDYTESGEKYTVTGDTTFYALFSYTAAGEGGPGIWTLVENTSELSAGSKIVLTENSKGVVAAPLNGQILLDVAATFSADKKTIPTMPSGAQIFTLGGNAGAWTLNNESGKALGATAVKKLSYTGGNSIWTISISGGDATVQNTNSSYGRFLYNAGAPRFTTYTSNSSSSMLLPQIYMLKNGETTYYTTAACKHENTTDVPAVPATCTEGGYTAGVYCNDCETYISGHEPVESTGHDYEGVVTPPTATEEGYTTYTCSNCGDSYVGDRVPALGEGVTVSFSVPAGVTEVSDMTCTTAGITLPEAGAPAGGYTFLGWIEEVVDHSSTEPSGYYKAGDKFVTDEGTTLRALYRLTEGGDGTESFLLVENVSQLYAGAKVVIASADVNVALSTTNNGNNRAQAAIEKSGKSITLGSNVAVLDLGEGTKPGTWSFYCPSNSGYLYAASSSSNYLKTKAALDDNGSFAITVSGGVADIRAQGDKTHNWIRYNPGNDIFSCYLNTQDDVNLYIKTVSGTVTYTTEITQDPGHTHSGTFHEADPATCTENGTIAYYECSCGEKFSDEDCTQKLSSIVDPKKGHNFTKEDAKETYKKQDANCQEPAMYYVSCSRCGVSSRGSDHEKTFTKGDVDTTKHNTSQTYILNAKDATCTEDGYTGDVYCAGCSTKLRSGEVIPAGHDPEPVEGTPATHKAAGLKAHYECERCGKLFLDEDAEEEVDAEDLIIPKIEHTFGSYKSDKTNHWKECSCGEKSSKGTHTYGSWKTVKAATKTAKGEKQRVCSVCGYTQSQSIPMTATPATGDNRPIGFYLAMMAISFCSLCCTVIFWPRRGKYSR